MATAPAPVAETAAVVASSRPESAAEPATTAGPGVEFLLALLGTGLAGVAADAPGPVADPAATPAGPPAAGAGGGGPVPRPAPPGPAPAPPDVVPARPGALLPGDVPGAAAAPPVTRPAPAVAGLPPLADVPAVADRPPAAGPAPLAARPAPVADLPAPAADRPAPTADPGASEPAAPAGDPVAAAPAASREPVAAVPAPGAPPGPGTMAARAGRAGQVAADDGEEPAAADQPAHAAGEKPAGRLEPGGLAASGTHQPAGAADAAPGPPADEPRGEPVEPRPVVEQVVARLRALGEGRQRLTLRLEPPELGPVHIDAVLRGGRLRLAIVVEQEATRGLLEAGLDRLRESLAGHGFSADRLTLDLGTGGTAGDAFASGRDLGPRPSGPGGAARPEVAASPAPPAVRVTDTAGEGLDLWV